MAQGHAETPLFCRARLSSLTPTCTRIRPCWTVGDKWLLFIPHQYCYTHTRQVCETELALRT